MNVTSVVRPTSIIELHHKVHWETTFHFYILDLFSICLPLHLKIKLKSIKLYNTKDKIHEKESDKLDFSKIINFLVKEFFRI